MGTLPASMPARVSRATAGLAVAFVLVMMAGAYRLSRPTADAPTVEVHRPKERAEILGRISDAIVPAGTERPSDIECRELVNVKQAFDTRLSTLSDGSDASRPPLREKYVFDLSRYSPPRNRHCRAAARELDAEMKRSWPLIAANENWREQLPKGSAGRRESNAWQPDLRDIETRNAWAILPGCIRSRTGAAVGGTCGGRPADGIADLLDDPMLADAIEHRLSRASQSPDGRKTDFRGREVEVGRDLTITLDPSLQSRASALARCFTGETGSCDGFLPDHLSRDWHFAPGMMRAGAAAVVIVHARSGEVVAAAGRLSGCVRANLAQPAKSVREGGRERLPVFRPGSEELCSQFPDSRGAQTYLTLPPALWLVGPGSTMKTFALLAGVEAGRVPAREDARFRQLLAASRDPDGGQAVPQRIARLSAPEFRQLLQRAGFADEGVDVLFGGDERAGWRIPVRAGFVDQAFSLSEDSFLQIQAAKRSGRNADALFGHRLVADYLRAQRLSVAAIGGGDIRHSAWGLADWTRRLALRASGADEMAPTHLVRDANASPPRTSLEFARVDSARRLNAMLSGATSSRIGGTAAGSCRVAFGTCPPDGHPAVLFAKTGTSEATDGGEASPYMKPGGAGTPPAKLFMAAFVGTDGEIYAGGAVTLRVRERPGSPKPELHSNSAAELLLLAAAPLLKKTD